MIRIDDYSASVYEIQKQLRILYRHIDVIRYQIIPNGHYDEQTRANVVSFQRYVGLEPTGVVNYQTWQDLFAQPIVNK